MSTVGPGPTLPWRWRLVAVAELAAAVLERCTGRPAVVAVDGHSSSGKSSFVPRLTTALPHAAVLHTDDIAWNHGVFAWDELLRHEVLPRVRTGEPMTYRPPGWVAHERPGAVELPGDLEILVVEGVGASQGSLADVIDVALWVETDEPTRLARDLVRVAAGETTPEDYASWMAEENAYVTASRPWERATFVVRGSPADGQSDDEVAVAGWPYPSSRG